MQINVNTFVGNGSTHRNYQLARQERSLEESKRTPTSENSDFQRFKGHSDDLIVQYAEHQSRKQQREGKSRLMRMTEAPRSQHDTRLESYRQHHLTAEVRSPVRNTLDEHHFPTLSRTRKKVLRSAPTPAPVVKNNANSIRKETPKEKRQPRVSSIALGSIKRHLCDAITQRQQSQSNSFEITTFNNVADLDQSEASNASDYHQRTNCLYTNSAATEEKGVLVHRQHRDERSTSRTSTTMHGKRSEAKSLQSNNSNHLRVRKSGGSTANEVGNEKVRESVHSRITEVSKDRPNRQRLPYSVENEERHRTIINNERQIRSEQRRYGDDDWPESDAKNARQCGKAVMQSRSKKGYSTHNQHRDNDFLDETSHSSPLSVNPHAPSYRSAVYTRDYHHHKSTRENPNISNIGENYCNSAYNAGCTSYQQYKEEQEQYYLFLLQQQHLYYPFSFPQQRMPYLPYASSSHSQAGPEPINNLGCAYNYLPVYDEASRESENGEEHIAGASSSKETTPISSPLFAHALVDDFFSAEFEAKCTLVVDTDSASDYSEEEGAEERGKYEIEINNAATSVEVRNDANKYIVFEDIASLFDAKVVHCTSVANAEENCLHGNGVFDANPINDSSCAIGDRISDNAFHNDMKHIKQFLQVVMEETRRLLQEHRKNQAHVSIDKEPLEIAP